MALPTPASSTEWWSSPKPSRPPAFDVLTVMDPFYQIANLGPEENAMLEGVGFRKSVRLPRVHIGSR